MTKTQFQNHVKLIHLLAPSTKAMETEAQRIEEVRGYDPKLAALATAHQTAQAVLHAYVADKCAEMSAQNAVKTFDPTSLNLTSWPRSPGVCCSAGVAFRNETKEAPSKHPGACEERLIDMLADSSLRG